MFTIAAAAAPIEPGARFQLQGPRLAEVSIETDPCLELDEVRDDRCHVTVVAPIAAGGSAAVRVTGGVTKRPVETYSLSPIVLAPDEIAPWPVRGSHATVSLHGVLVGICGGSRAALREGRAAAAAAVVALPSAVRAQLPRG